VKTKICDYAENGLIGFTNTIKKKSQYILFYLYLFKKLKISRLGKQLHKL